MTKVAMVFRIFLKKVTAITHKFSQWVKIYRYQEQNVHLSFVLPSRTTASFRERRAAKGFSLSSSPTSSTKRPLPSHPPRPTAAAAARVWVGDVADAATKRGLRNEARPPSSHRPPRPRAAAAAAALWADLATSTATSAANPRPPSTSVGRAWPWRSLASCSSSTEAAASVFRCRCFGFDSASAS